MTTVLCLQGAADVASQSIAVKDQNMVVLQSYDSELPWVKSTTSAIRKAVANTGEFNFSLNIEYLDLARELQPAYRHKIKELIEVKYRVKQPDIILCVDMLASHFLAEYKAALFPDVPVVFTLPTETYHQIKSRLPRNSAVVTNQVDYSGTLAQAFALFPDTRQVYVIAGQTKVGRTLEQGLTAAMAPYKNRARLNSLSHYGYDEILKAVQTLPENSVIFQLLFLADLNGKKYIPVKVLEAVTQRANAPIFSLYEPLMGHGALGGKMVTPQQIQQDAVTLAAQLIKSPDAHAGTVRTTESVSIFDWRRMQQWQIPEKALPGGSEIRFRQYTFFQLHRYKILAGAAIVFVQALLILFLVANLIRRKKAEAVLLESRELLKESLEELSLKNMVLENAPVSVFFLDSEGRIFYANKMAVHSYGYARKALEGLNIWDIDLKLSKDRFHDLWTRMVDGNAFEGESVHRKKDGSTFPIESYARQTSYRNQRLSFGFIIDISKRKAAEEHLRISENRYRSILATAMDGFQITDTGGRLTLVNQAYCRMVGYTEEELLSMSVFDLDAMLTKAQIQDRIFGVMGKGQMRFESRHRHKSGRILDVEISASCQAGNGDSQFYFVRDITEQKQVQAALRHSQKMEAIGTLAGGIAHDFNNILGAIIGYADLLRHRHKTNSDLKGPLEKILHAGHRAKGLVMQILLFSRKSEPRSIPLGIQPMVKEIVKLLKATLPPTIEITLDLSDGTGQVLADPDQIHQIIMNLCTNAVYAMEDKGQLSIGLSEALLDQDAAGALNGVKPGRYVRLQVSDTGCGIPEDIMDQIFDPFFTTKPVGKGTGLGLSVMHGILQSHGGAVKVYSETGKGTTFNVFLPAIQSSVQIETHTEKVVPTGTETIMVVDDEAALVDVTTSMLQRLGYTVHGFTDSMDAWRCFQSNPRGFDLVLTDKSMPDMSGIQLAKKMLALCPEIPVIMCTGFFDAPFLELTGKSGIRDVLSKPVLADDLAVVIRRVLSDAKA